MNDSKKVYCGKCKHHEHVGVCSHHKNIETRSSYFNVSEYYICRPQEANKDNNCSLYEEQKPSLAKKILNFFRIGDLDE